MLITGERYLRLVLGEYVDHHSTHLLHSTLQQYLPAGRAHPTGDMVAVHVLRRDRLAT